MTEKNTKPCMVNAKIQQECPKNRGSRTTHGLFSLLNQTHYLPLCNDIVKE